MSPKLQVVGVLVAPFTYDARVPHHNVTGETEQRLHQKDYTPLQGLSLGADWSALGEVASKNWRVAMALRKKSSKLTAM